MKRVGLVLVAVCALALTLWCGAELVPRDPPPAVVEVAARQVTTDAPTVIVPPARAASVLTSTRIARGERRPQPAARPTTVPASAPRAGGARRRWSPGLDALGSPEHPGALRSWHARLAYLPTSLDHDGTPLREVLRMLERESGVPIRVDPGVAAAVAEARVSLRLRGISLRNALRLALAASEELGFEMRDDGVWVVSGRYATTDWVNTLEPVPTAQDLAALTLKPEWARRIERLLERRRVTVNFDGAPLADVVSFLQDITGLNIVTRTGIDATATVRLRRRDVLLRTLLQELLTPLKLGYVFQNETLVVETAAAVKRRRDAEADAERRTRAANERGRPLLQARVAGFTGSLAAAARHIASAAGARPALDAAARAGAAVVSITPDVTVEQACEQLAFATGADWRLMRDPDAKPPAYYLQIRGNHDAFYAPLVTHLQRIEQLGADPRAAHLLRDLRAARERLTELRRQGSTQTDLAALRDAASEVSKQERALAGQALRARLAVDALEAERDVPAEPLRVLHLAELIAWSNLATGCRCRDRDLSDADARLPQTGCAHLYRSRALALALRLGRGPALPAAEHPGRALLRDAD